MDEHKYEIKRRQSDKRWCIYLVKFNVVIAEFVENITQGSIDDIILRLTNKPWPPNDACPKGGEHKWGIDGMHSNEFCKKCFVSSGD